MSGKVVDSRSRQPVEGATVTVVGSKANPEVTDHDGDFILTFSPTTRAGEVVQVRVAKSGYEVYQVLEPISSPAMPLQFPISKLGPDRLPRAGRGNAPARPLTPLIKEDIWSVLIPFNDGDGEPVPAYKMPAKELGKFPSLGLFYAHVAELSKRALEGRDRPHSPEAINLFLEEIVRYHLLDLVDQLQHDRVIQSWDYRTGAGSSVVPADAPPEFVEYPNGRIIDLISNTPLGDVPDVMTYWRSRTDSFRVPANSTVRFLTTPENGTEVYGIQISNAPVFTLTLSVSHGLTVLNYGLIPPGFELTPATVQRTLSYNLVVKCRLEFRRFSETDPLLQDEYVKWAEGLFAGLRRSMVD